MDELSARLSVSMGSSHYDYQTLACRIIISNNHKNTPKKFSDCIRILYKNKRWNEHNPLVSKEVYEVATENAYDIDSWIIDDNDYTYDYFAYKTLEKYLLHVDGKPVEEFNIYLCVFLLVFMAMI